MNSPEFRNAVHKHGLLFFCCDIDTSIRWTSLMLRFSFRKSGMIHLNCEQIG